MLALYYKKSCPYCLRARLTLAEKQLPFGRRIVTTPKPPELEELSGGKVPVLIENSLAVRDSTVIAEYLEERFPTPALLPPGPRERALVRMMMIDIENRLMTPLEEIVRKKSTDEAACNRVADAFASFDYQIGDAGMLLGMAFSFADIWLLSAWELAALLDVDLSSSGPGFPRWIERVRERKSAQEERLSFDS